MNNARELNFAYKIRHALNEHLDTLPASTTERLACIRKAALAHKKAEAPRRVAVSQKTLAGGVGNFGNEPLSWLGRIGLVIPVVVLVAGLVGIVQHEKQQRIDETADIDAAMLTDDLPLVAYADHGFNAYLAKREE